MAKQSPDDGVVTAKHMLVKNRRSASWPSSEPVQEGKQTKLHPTAVFNYGADLSLVQKMGWDEETPVQSTIGISDRSKLLRG